MVAVAELYGETAGHVGARTGVFGGVAADVARALETLLAGVPDPPVVTPGCDARAEERAASDEAFLAALTAVLQARETVHNWVDGLGVAATGALREHAAAVTCPGPPESLTAGQRRQWQADADQATVQELELVTGAGGAGGARAGGGGYDTAGAARGAHRPSADRAAPLHRVHRVVQATQDLPATARAEIADTVLRPGRQGQARSPASFRQALHRQLARHKGSDAAAARHARDQALSRRRVSTLAEPDGMARLSLTGGTERIVAAAERIDAIARRFRRAGDQRTLDQLRADVATDLMLYATMAHPDAAAGSAPACQDTGGYRVLGALPPARITVVVGLDTLLNVGDGIGWVPGQGHLSGEHVRELALTAGGVLERLVVDPVTGYAVERSTPRYRPDAAMRRFLAARDGTCRAPGCTTSTDLTDVDHAVNWRSDGSGGHTAATGLDNSCRRHHNRKTRRLLDADLTPEGVLTWRTILGSTATTTPMNYNDLLNPGRQPVPRDEDGDSAGDRDGDRESSGRLGTLEPSAKLRAQRRAQDRRRTRALRAAGLTVLVTPARDILRADSPDSPDSADVTPPRNAFLTRLHRALHDTGPRTTRPDDGQPPPF